MTQTNKNSYEWRRKQQNELLKQELINKTIENIEVNENFLICISTTDGEYYEFGPNYRAGEWLRKLKTHKEMKTTINNMEVDYEL
jgi:hypothetical protein